MSDPQDLSPLSLELDEDMARHIASLVNRTGRAPEEIVAQALRMYFRGFPLRNSVYLSAPVSALVEGIYEENTTLAEIRQHGDFGLGTFNDLDGEMIMLEGTTYQCQADGAAAAVKDDVKTPFACVTYFSPDTTETLTGRFDYPAFIDLLNRCIPSNNLFYALRIDGRFEAIRTRSVPRQQNYTPLVEATKGQTVKDMRDIEGTLVGFYSPAFVSSIHVPGYHLHFLSADRKIGGHVLECCMLQGTIGVQNVTRMELHLPVTFDFLTYETKRDAGSDLHKAER